MNPDEIIYFDIRKASLDTSYRYWNIIHLHDIFTNRYLNITLNFRDKYSKNIYDFMVPGYSSTPEGYPYLFITKSGKKPKKSEIKKYKEKYIGYFI